MQPLSVSEYLRQHIRTVPDWPAPGVQFRDITPLLQDPQVFRVLIDAFVHRYMGRGMRPDVVAGLDAFDKHHALAPAVPALRFRLAPQSGAEQAAAELALRHLEP